jgi:hypothetical protein
MKMLLLRRSLKCRKAQLHRKAMGDNQYNRTAQNGRTARLGNSPPTTKFSPGNAELGYAETASVSIHPLSSVPNIREGFVPEVKSQTFDARKKEEVRWSVGLRLAHEKRRDGDRRMEIF